MPFLKFALIALCWEISLTAVVNNDIGDCAAFPKEDASLGEHAMIQHSKPLKLVGSLEQDMLPGSSEEQKVVPSSESSNAHTEQEIAEKDDVMEENEGSLEEAKQSMVLEEEADAGSMGEKTAVPSLGSKYSQTENATAEQDDIMANVGSLKDEQKVFQSSETSDTSEMASLPAQPAVTDKLVTQSVGACDWQCYLSRYPDLQEIVGADFAAAEEHWNSLGQKEGRDCTCAKEESFAVLEENMTQDVAVTSPQSRVQALDIMTSCEPWSEAAQETLQAALRAYEESEKFEEKMTEATGESPATAGHVAIMKYLREKVLKPGFSVLELGCAAGGMLRLVRDEYDIGWAGVPYADPVPHDSLVGVELVAGWVKFAQKHLKNISIFEGDITEYSLPEPYSNKTFDLVMLNDVMGQVEKTRYGCFFSQLDRATHPGSIVYMHAPSPSGLVANKNQGFDKENTVPHHFVQTGMATIGFELVAFEHDMDTVCGGEVTNVPKQLEGAHCYQNGWPKYTHNVFRKVQDNTVLNLS